MRHHQIGRGLTVAIRLIELLTGTSNGRISLAVSNLGHSLFERHQYALKNDYQNGLYDGESVKLLFTHGLKFRFTPFWEQKLDLISNSG